MELVRNLLLPDRIVWSVRSFSLFAPLLSHCYLFIYFILLSFLYVFLFFLHSPLTPSFFWGGCLLKPTSSARFLLANDSRVVESSAR